MSANRAVNQARYRLKKKQELDGLRAEVAMLHRQLDRQERQNKQSIAEKIGLKPRGGK